jgi:hypothetical protein
MTRSRCGELAAWTSAWLAGSVSLAGALSAATGGDRPHQVHGLGGAEDLAHLDGEPVPLREALLAWQRRRAEVRVVLPVAGDVRGLPGPAALRSAALDAGEAICAAGLALVPQVIDYSPSSAPPTVVWQAFRGEPPPTDPLTVRDAQYELTEAVRESATALAAADVAGSPADIADRLRRARRAGEHLNLPPGWPNDAVALLAQAERLQAVLDLAHENPAGGAIDRTGIAARADGLRALATAVRRARSAGYNALAVSG